MQTHLEVSQTFRKMQSMPIVRGVQSLSKSASYLKAIGESRKSNHIHLKCETYSQDARWQAKVEGYATAKEYRKGVGKRRTVGESGSKSVGEAIVVPQDGEGDNRRESE
jgi:hypothetical protein